MITEVETPNYKDIKHPYIQTLYLNMTTRADGNEQPLDVDKFVSNNFDLIAKYLSKEFSRKGDTTLIMLCYEPKDEKRGKIPHSHFHFLVGIDNPSTKKTYARMKKAMNSLKVYLQKIGLLKPEHRFYKDYRGTGKGYQNGCPDDVAQQCPNKDNCLNNTKPNSCVNIVKSITSSPYFDNMVDYILRDKVTGGDKQCVFINTNKPISTNTELPLSPKVKSFNKP